MGLYMKYVHCQWDKTDYHYMGVNRILVFFQFYVLIVILFYIHKLHQSLLILFYYFIAVILLAGPDTFICIMSSCLIRDWVLPPLWSPPTLVDWWAFKIDPERDAVCFLTTWHHHETYVEAYRSRSTHPLPGPAGSLILEGGTHAYNDSAALHGSNAGTGLHLFSPYYLRSQPQCRG